MFIIYSICIGLTVAVGTFFTVRAVCVAKIEREKRAFANLPREVLLTHAQLNPFYMSDYATMVLGGVSKERATEIITDRMLISMGLIGYRKEET